jgi:ferredoxin
MYEMKPELMGGFRTSLGPELATCISIPIPILNQDILDAVCEARDENIIVPVDDIGDREIVGQIRYSDVYGKDAPLEFEYDQDKCMTCSFTCPVEYYCPMKAFSRFKKEIDQDKCFHCGACVFNCIAGAFKKKNGEHIRNLGSPYIESLGIHIPIIWRMSDRLRAQEETEYLKELMLDGEFLLIDTDFDMQQSRKISEVGL